MMRCIAFKLHVCRTVHRPGPADCPGRPQTACLEAGWDFVDETANGTEDIWWILEGQDYPGLWWEAAGP